MPPDEYDPPPAAHDDDASPPRLRTVGSGFERQLLGSGELDAPTPEARDRTHAAARLALDAALTRTHDRRWRTLLISTAAIALAAIGGAALWARGGAPRAEVVPRAEPLPPIAPAPLPAAALPPCRKVTVGAGLDPLIDDFEDGNARLLLREGRAGAWLSTGDPAAKQIPRPGTTAFPVLDNDARHGGRHALRLRTERLTVTSAGLNADLTPGQCYDASAYAGIEFRAKGSGRIFFGPTMIDIMEQKWGGLCVEDCYDRHVAPADLTSEWKLYRFLWKDLEQSGWGHQVPFDPTRLLSIGFSVEVPDTPSDLWIDDVRFIQR
jgi:hypothetical protein